MSIIFSLVLGTPSFAGNCTLSVQRPEINLYGYVFEFGPMLATPLIQKLFVAPTGEQTPENIFAFAYGDVAGKRYPTARIDFKITEIATGKILYTKTETAPCYLTQLCQITDYRKLVLKAINSLAKNNFVCVK